MEIVFQNKKEDMDAFIDYMLKETQEGKRIGKYGFDNRQAWMIMFVALLSSLFWGATGSGGFSLFMAIVLFGLVEFFIFLSAGFKPRYYYGKQIYKNQEKSFTVKDLEVFQLKRTLTAEDDWLEIRSSEAVHRWKWRNVDQIGITPDFVFIHVGNCPVVYVPKRDFPSEQSFVEFGKKLVELREKYKGQPVGLEQ